MKQPIPRIDISTASFPINIWLEVPMHQIEIYGTKALSASVNIDETGGRAAEAGDTIEFINRATFTGYGANVVNFMGVAMPEVYADKDCIIKCYYTGSAWDVQFHVDGNQDDIIIEGMIEDDAVTTAKILDANVTYAKLVGLPQGSILRGSAAGVTEAIDAKTPGNILYGNGTTIALLDLSAAGSMAVGTGATVKAAKLTEVVQMYLSCDSAAELGDYKIEFPYACTVDKLLLRATDTIVTDDMDVTVKNNTAATMATMTLSAGTLIGTSVTDSPGANNTFTANQTLTATVGPKATPGGHAVLDIHLTRDSE